jgi:hypothetical protein
MKKALLILMLSVVSTANAGEMDGKGEIVFEGWIPVELSTPAEQAEQAAEVKHGKDRDCNRMAEKFYREFIRALRLQK